MSKTNKRTNWIKDNEAAITASVIPLNGSTHNAYHNQGMSGGGWGYWVNAFRAAGMEHIAHPMPYWSGSNPTPSTAINRGVADYIRANAPHDLL